MNLFPWARFRRTKAAIKLHTLLDLRGSIPTMIAISDGKQADVRVLDELIPEPGAFYVMDRGYVDFQRLHQFEMAGAFFVTRSKTNLQFNRLASRPVDASTGVRSDQIIWLRNPASIQHYPDKLRRIHYVDAKTGKSLVFLTNNFDLPAATIAQLLAALPGGVVLQMDQTEPADHAFLRHHRQRGQDPGMGRSHRLCPGGHRAQTTRIGSQLVAIATDFEREHL